MCLCKGSKIDLRKNITCIKKIMSGEFVSKSKKSTLEKEWKYQEYIKMRSNAEKNGDEWFVYKNITYVQCMRPSTHHGNTQRGVVIYVRQQNF